MKLFISAAFALFLSIFPPAAGAAEEQAISISIAAPELAPAGSDAGEHIIIVSKESHFHVVLTNVSNKEQRIVEEHNSTGDHALSFEITDAAGRKTVVRQQMRAYSKNVPHWWVLQPSEHLVLDVAVMDAQWHPAFPRPSRYGNSETVTMSAIFELKPEETDPKDGLWTGRVVSKPMKYVFSSRIPDTK